MLVRMEATQVRAMLARAPGLTAEHVRALFDLTGSESNLGAADALRQVGMPPAARAFLTSPDQAQLRSDLQWIEASGAQLILCTDAAYPPLLAQTAGAPPVLFVLGCVEALYSPQLAMVGSRNPTAAGRKTARDFAAGLAYAGLTITSGLAVGVDAASHEGALLVEGASTVAVFGTGLDAVYPSENRKLAARIRERGALVSEFPPRTGPSPRNFPRRNRIISGLSRGTLVVEAAHRSGSLVTARLAAEQGREVFAIPGSIHSPLSRGCHKLIREGATLVETAGDVLSELGIPLCRQRVTRPAVAGKGVVALDKEYEMLLDAFGFEPATLDALVARTGLPGESIASMLLILELEGCVAALPGGRYDRIPE
jgi:DNA processing protein